MRIKININNINSISVLFAAAMSFYIVLLGTNSLFNLFAYGTSIDTMLVYGIYAAIILMSVIPIFRHVSSIQWLLFICFIFVSIWGCLLNPSCSDRIIKALFMYSSFFLVGVSLQDNENLERYVCISVVIAVLFSGVYTIFSLLVPGRYIHDMTAAYSILPSAILAVYFALSKRKTAYYLCFVASALELFAMGVRGPILIYIISGVIILFRYIKKNYQKVLLILVAAIVLYFIASVQFVTLLNSLNNYLSKFGITNGIIKSLLRNSFFDDDGRTFISNSVWQAINEKPILGHGIFFDRVLLNGGYTHNIFTEMILDFGYVFGILLFLGVIWRIVVLLKKTRGNMFGFCLVLMVIALSLGQNFFSGSYLENEFFFLLIGMSFNRELWSNNIKRSKLNSNCKDKL